MNPAFIILGAIIAVFLIIAWSSFRLVYMADETIERLVQTHGRASQSREENPDA